MSNRINMIRMVSVNVHVAAATVRAPFLMLSDLQATLDTGAGGGRTYSVSFRAVKGLSSGGESDNAMIHGDNQLALELRSSDMPGKSGAPT